MVVKAEQTPLTSLDIKYSLRKKALELGFELFGVTSTDQPNSFQHYKTWLNESKHASMEFMGKNIDVRKDPLKILPEAKSIISLGAFYTPPKTNKSYFSSYALGKDYHKVLKKRLRELEKFAKSELGITHTRSSVDTAPILERDIAQRAGLGWIGKNTLLINQKKGSFFFISELFISERIENDLPGENLCGTCTSCIDACPTQALKPYELDSNRCISYWTIEHRGDYPSIEEFGEHIFGCDICQTVCPWNRFAPESKFEELKPSATLTSPDLKKLMSLDEFEFNEIFNGTAIKRTKHSGLQRNLRNALSKSKMKLADFLN